MGEAYKKPYKKALMTLNVKYLKKVLYPSFSIFLLNIFIIYRFRKFYCFIVWQFACESVVNLEVCRKSSLIRAPYQWRYYRSTPSLPFLVWVWHGWRRLMADANSCLHSSDLRNLHIAHFIKPYRDQVHL